MLAAHTHTHSIEYLYALLNDSGFDINSAIKKSNRPPQQKNEASPNSFASYLQDGKQHRSGASTSCTRVPAPRSTPTAASLPEMNSFISRKRRTVPSLRLHPGCPCGCGGGAEPPGHSPGPARGASSRDASGVRRCRRCTAGRVPRHTQPIAAPGCFQTSFCGLCRLDLFISL